MTRSLRDSEPALACIVLAAGGSRRLGRPKQLLRERVRPLLERTVALAEGQAPGRVVVVLGAEQLRLRGVLRRSGLAPRIVHNAAWPTGLASSLKAGLAATPAGTAAALVLLTDQPRVDATSLARLVGAWRRRPTRAAAARYSGRIGVPAILPRTYYAKLRHAAAADMGARALLAEDSQISLVEMPEAAVDIDAPEDWAALERGRAARRLSVSSPWPRRRLRVWRS